MSFKNHKNPALFSLISFCFLILLAAFSFPESVKPSAIEGAWKMESVNGAPMNSTIMLLIADGYGFSTEYNMDEKKFVGSQGGQFVKEGDNYTFTIEFNTWDGNLVGSTFSFTTSIDGSKLTMVVDGETTMVYSRVDDGSSDLFGAWRITDRMRSGTMTAMRQGPRKTIKMITGSRFQWAAYNKETGQFSGTGGGSISLKDGKYTEHIEFFSRNPDRVGASLTFDYKVDGIKWDHSGLSSSGNPIREIWTRQNQD